MRINIVFIRNEKDKGFCRRHGNAVDKSVCGIFPFAQHVACSRQDVSKMPRTVYDRWPQRSMCRSKHPLAETLIDIVLLCKDRAPAGRSVCAAQQPFCMKAKEAIRSNMFVKRKALCRNLFAVQVFDKEKPNDSTLLKISFDQASRAFPRSRCLSIHPGPRLHWNYAYLERQRTPRRSIHRVG